jgi:hypothetical protein
MSHKSLIYVDAKTNLVVGALARWYKTLKIYTWYVYVCYDEEMNMHGKYHMYNEWIWISLNI